MLNASATLTFNLYPSRTLIILIGLIYLGAAISTFLLPLNFFLKSLLVFIVLTGCLMSLLNQGLRLAPFAITTVIIRDHESKLLQRDGNVIHAFLTGQTYLTRSLVILNFRVNHFVRYRSVVVLKDSVDPGMFRKLKACLKLSPILKK